MKWIKHSDQEPPLDTDLLIRYPTGEIITAFYTMATYGRRKSIKELVSQCVYCTDGIFSDPEAWFNIEEIKDEVD